MHEDRTDLKIQIVYYLVRNKVTGSHNKTVDTVKDRAAIPVHAEGAAEKVIRELITDPGSPVVAYGGQRDTIKLTSISEGVEFIEDLGGDPPFGFG